MITFKVYEKHERRKYATEPKTRNDALEVSLSLSDHVVTCDHCSHLCIPCYREWHRCYRDVLGR